MKIEDDNIPSWYYNNNNCSLGFGMVPNKEHWENESIELKDLVWDH
jgi:hypothetical protein